MIIEDKFSNLNIILNSIEEDKEKIVKEWLKIEENEYFFDKFNNNLKEVLKIFALKILEHQFDIVSKNNKYGIFDTVAIIMKILLNKKFTILDIYQTYSNLKNVTLFFYIKKFPELKDNFYYSLANLFDRNYTIFLNEILLDDYKMDYFNYDNSKNVENKTKISNDDENQRKKDIRFTKIEKIDTSEFIEELDDSVFDRVDTMLEDIDEIFILLYSLDESSDIKNSMEILEKINEYLSEIPELLISLGIFKVVERAFVNLIEFLSTITEEMLKDKDKKTLLVNLLLALINDFENWLKVIFIDKTARDIHYFDASFSANILKIENIFNEEESENSENDDCEIEFF